MKKLYNFPPMLVLSIFTSILLVLFVICFFVTQVLLKPDLYSQSMKKNNVAEAIYTELDTYFTSYSIPSNIPKEVFMSSVSEENLGEAANELLVDSLRYLTVSTAPKPQIKYDFTAVETDITNYFEQYVEQNDIEKNDEYYKMLDTTVQTACDQIESRLDVMMLYTFSQTGLAGALHKYVNLINTAAMVTATLILVLVGVMFIINRRHPRDMPYWIGAVLFCSSTALLVPAVYLERTGFFEGFFMKTENIFRTVTGFFQSALDKLILSLVILLVISVLLIVSAQVIHNIYKAYRKKLYYKRVAAEMADEED